MTPQTLRLEGHLEESCARTTSLFLARVYRDRVDRLPGYRDEMAEIYVWGVGVPAGEL